MEDDLKKMEDDLKKNGRRPQKKMEDDLKKMEDDLKKIKIWKTISSTIFKKNFIGCDIIVNQPS